MQPQDAGNLQGMTSRLASCSNKPAASALNEILVVKKKPASPKLRVAPAKYLQDDHPIVSHQGADKTFDWAPSLKQCAGFVILRSRCYHFD